VKITGSWTVDAPKQAFWEALQDPEVLARTLPGCSSLQVVGQDEYAATVTAGVASVQGTYSGTVQLRDKQPHDSYRLTARGSGTPGTIEADATVRLEVDGDTTIVHYDADAVVGGMLGGVGQRMIAGAARRTAGEFFSAVANEVLYGPIGAEPEEAEPVTPAPGAVPASREAPAVGTVFAGRAATAPAARSSGGLLGAFALGAAVALLGVLVGWRAARRDG
jgi:carbon monoxide dehydrogenase subunit G